MRSTPFYGRMLILSVKTLGSIYDKLAKKFITYFYPENTRYVLWEFVAAVEKQTEGDLTKQVLQAVKDTQGTQSIVYLHPSDTTNKKSKCYLLVNIPNSEEKRVLQYLQRIPGVQDYTVDPRMLLLLAAKGHFTIALNPENKDITTLWK